MRAEIAYFQATGEWLCAGEYSPTSALSAVYAALGQLEEAAFVLDAARFRYRIYRCGMFERLAEVPPEEILRAARED
ncbi:MAG: hypothetical protein D6771_09510 [Zetaproteobacteria bacterium]|nr:MAG: hypothetical protein D6771_09510 [Zetaproteobacteria bacterium]